MTERLLPTFNKLPPFHEWTGCAWDVWGKGDQLGTVNLLTDDVIKEAAKEIKLGKAVCLNWPVNFLKKPMFRRQSPHHEIYATSENGTINDEILHINTQSGSQWDGLKHFGIGAHMVMYQNIPSVDFQRGEIVIADPKEALPELIKLGIHSWADHGICGRGVFLDMVHFYTDSGAKPLPYDPWTTHPIPLADLLACAAKEGVIFRRGDILLLRVGFMQRWNATAQAERDALQGKQETFAGIEQTEEMKAFLWNNHFAAIASDQPSLERWPDPEGLPRMHQTLLGLWGMPIGEFFELENLSRVAAETGRYTFFFSSWPLNILGGVASPPNAAAYF
ncbi:hypothetical protein B0H21DRAFT_38796 [Amylocystis lapponica]|nr:hypothetical protein B0H21DRAFT_38796 [Amylocystis lapponica]